METKNETYKLSPDLREQMTQAVIKILQEVNDQKLQDIYIFVINIQ